MSVIEQTKIEFDERLGQERLAGQSLFNRAGEPTVPSQMLPFDLRNEVPTMLVDAELNYLHWLASETQGWGSVIDLGCFLGGSTNALCAGLEYSGKEETPVFSYDAFVYKGSDLEESLLRSVLSQFSITFGTSFRDRYEQNTSAYSHMVSVQEGFITTAGTRTDTIYPGQQPVELLFIDIAKAWGVHETVLRTFGPHLQRGSTVVQQDFFDCRTPWIPLHMYQLRDKLVPQDIPLSTPTLGLRCESTLDESLDRLWTEQELFDKGAREAAWNSVIAYWTELTNERIAECFCGHAAVHALHSGDGEGAAYWGRRYERWSRSNQSDRVYFSSSWSTLMEHALELSATLTSGREAFLELAAESVARGSRRPWSRSWAEENHWVEELRPGVWERVISSLLDQDSKRIALLGAGSHTRWLLEKGPSLEGIEVVCIVDHSPLHETINGIPVNTPDCSSDLLRSVDAIVPSSDAFEAKLIERFSNELGEDLASKLVRVYTDPAMTGLERTDTEHGKTLSWLYELRVPAESQRELTQPVLETSAKEPMRAELGLPIERSWHADFLDTFRPPEWCYGNARQHESAFLWDLIESSKPRVTVEIGTASGVSTAMLLAGVKQFCADDALVYSYDIARQCYFDVSRPLGDAIGHMVPELVTRARMHAGSDAIDAASCFGTGEIDLAFIDGNHGHPMPTLDLLALVYAVKPKSWVVLHDIELDAFWNLEGNPSKGGTTGACMLFRTWPFMKIQPTAEEPVNRNIGAIRMPENPLDAVQHLLSLLPGPYELGGTSVECASRAVSIAEARST